MSWCPVFSPRFVEGAQESPHSPRAVTAVVMEWKNVDSRRHSELFKLSQKLAMILYSSILRIMKEGKTNRPPKQFKSLRMSPT